MFREKFLFSGIFIRIFTSKETNAMESRFVIYSGKGDLEKLK